MQCRLCADTIVFAGGTGNTLKFSRLRRSKTADKRSSAGVVCSKFCTDYPWTCVWYGVRVRTWNTRLLSVSTLALSDTVDLAPGLVPSCASAMAHRARGLSPAGRERDCASHGLGLLAAAGRDSCACGRAERSIWLPPPDRRPRSYASLRW